MNEIIQQYLPEVMSVVTGFVSSGGVVVLAKYIMKNFGQLKENVKNDKEVAEMRKMLKEVNEKYETLIVKETQLIQQNHELKEIIKESKQ